MASTSCTTSSPRCLMHCQRFRRRYIWHVSGADIPADQLSADQLSADSFHEEVLMAHKAQNRKKTDLFGHLFQDVPPTTLFRADFYEYPEIHFNVLQSAVQDERGRLRQHTAL